MSASTSSTRLSAIMTLAVCGLALCLAACAPQGESAPPSTSSEEASTPVEFTWSKDSDCAACHETDARSFDDTSCAASQHASLKDDCLSCHDDESGLEEAHQKATLDSRKKKATLKKTEVPESVCLSCHDQTELAVATEGSVALTDKNGLVVNPHDLPVNDDHSEAGTTCSSCHKLHTSESAAKTAPAVCRNCHHADVYECNTCHAEK